MDEDQTIELADGRTLGYAEYGDPTGRPVFFFHGTPGTRHLGRATHSIARTHGLRLLCPDRPGFGLSDFQPDRSIPGWPADVVELADALGLERFGVIGVSGGGPYAAACARFIPERLAGVALVAGVGPFDAPGATRGMAWPNRIMFGLARWLPRLVGALTASMMKQARSEPDKFFTKMKASLPEPDQRVLERPEMREAMLASMDAARPDSARAIAQEMSLLIRPWGFELRDIRPEVHLFQGEQDRNVSPNMGRFQAEQIPSCQAHFYPNEGHVSVFANRGEDILHVFE